MTKLLNNETKKYDEIPGSEVNAAINSGMYDFGSTKNVPIAQDGAAVWVNPSYASKYRKGLTFLSDEDVLKGNATERFRGIGGTAAGLGYGFLKGATLGLAPLAIEALGGQGGKDFVRDIELGAPTATTIGDVGGLLVDPVAAFGRLGGKAVAKGAGLAAEHAGSSLTANEIAAAATRLETAAPAVAGHAGTPVAARLGVGSPAPAAIATAARAGTDIAPLRLGPGPMASGVADTSIGKALRSEKAAARADEAMQQKLLPPHQIEVPESPLTLGQPPFESRLMADVARRFGDTGFATGEIRTAEAGHADLELAAQRAEQARARNRMGQGAPDIIGRPVANQGVTAGRELVLGQPRPGVADVLRAEQMLGAEAGSMASLGARNAEAAAAETAAWREAGGTRAATQVERDIAAAEGVAPGRELAISPSGIAATAGRELAAAPAIGAATPAAVNVLGPASPTSLAGGFPSLSLPVQGAIYGGAGQLSREQAGLEEGEPGSVLKAAALGGAIPLVLGLGGKAFGQAAAATGSALSGNQRIQKFAAGIEETHVLRMADSGVADVQRINREFTTPLTGEQGTRKYADFIKNAVHNIDNIKADPSNAGNALVQSLPSAADGGTKLWNMNPQRLATLANATVSVYSAEYKALYNAVGHEPVALSTLQKIAADVRGMQASMAPTTSMKSVQGELNEFENAIARATPDPITGVAQQKFTINDLQDTRTRFGEAFSNTQAGGEWTPQQAAFYKGLRNGVVDAAESVKPGMKNTFDALDPLYTMAKSFQEGAARAAAKKAIKSPISQDQVTKASLGVAAIGTPGAAVLFFGVSTLFRHGYAQRGEGFIAEMAGKVAGSSLMANPAGAAQFVGASILNAKRPMMLGYNAERLVETTPKEYTEIVAAVHGLQATRDKVRADVMSSLSDSTPEQQRQTADNVDTLLNQMVNMLPTGLSPGKELTQQEKNYTIFFKALLDPTRFGTQVIVNGGPGVDAAKAALGATPQGQEYLDKLYTVLNEAVQSNEKLRSQKMGPGSIKKIITLFRSTSHSSLGTIHGAGAGQEAEGPSSPVAPSAATGARNAFAQNVSLGSGINMG